MAAGAISIREAAEKADTLEEKPAVFAQAFHAGEGYLSYLVSYTGKWKHPAVGAYIREFWTPPSNTFSLMAELSAVNGKLFISLQQRFREDTLREGFLRQLERHGVPYALRHVKQSDVAFLTEP